MSKQDIQIIIVDDSKAEKCDTKCGVDWSSAEAFTLVKQRIKDRFGDRVQLEYIDLSESDRALELSPGIKDLPVPILVINGEPRISGQFDIRLLLDAIDAEIEIRL
ncbi:MAG: hypothetical protein ACE5LA_00440 [Dehalococcoidales bacterium]